MTATASGLSAEQVRRFREEGVLVAEIILTDADLAPVIAEYAAWIDDRANLLIEKGKITELHADAPFRAARRPAVRAVARHSERHGHYDGAWPRHL